MYTPAPLRFKYLFYRLQLSDTCNTIEAKCIKNANPVIDPYSKFKQTQLAGKRFFALHFFILKFYIFQN